MMQQQCGTQLVFGMLGAMLIALAALAQSTDELIPVIQQSIADIELALKDGYTTAGGLGLGLSGSRRLSNEFEISSRVGEGTRVAIVRWK